MSRIIRTQAGSVLSQAVEFHGFVYTAGVTARDLSADVQGQTRDVLQQIDALLEAHGTDNTRLLQAQVWLKDIRDREALNEIWSAWLPKGGAPVRACVQANMADPRHLVEIMITACK
ncbi:MAG TPA: RidA family protein [Acetobacteraceae bacterium]|nr:RidA family protein [Acetobacteraceae bacterium]